MIVLGFDPGGGEKFGCAAYHIEDRNPETFTARSVDNAIEWTVDFLAERQPTFAGIDTLLFWQSTKSGWRGADEYLRNRYPASRSSVLCANGLYGSMAVQGAVLAHRLRAIYPDIGLTETHPKLLWTHYLPREPYPRIWDEGTPSTAEHWLRSQRLSAKLKNEDEFDALLSAWAAEQVQRGKWTLDLSTIPAIGQARENVEIVADVLYAWPDADTTASPQ